MSVHFILILPHLIILLAGMIAVAGLKPIGKLSFTAPRNLPASAILSIEKENFIVAGNSGLTNFIAICPNAVHSLNIIREKIIEITPFDNIIVLCNVNGSGIRQLLYLLRPNAVGHPMNSTSTEK